MNEAACIVALQLIDGVGHKTINKIIDSPSYVFSDGYKSFYSCYEAMKSITRKIPELENDQLEAIYEKSIEILNNQEKLGISTISCLEKNYPVGLTFLPTPPPLIHFKGNLDALNQKNVAVVGSRKMSPGTRNKVRELTAELVQREYNIVSGLAIGVDTVAHHSTIENKGKTVAVMAHGLEIITPRSNSTLASEIIENNGCLLSEHTIGTTPSKANYVTRNRLQVAVSNAVIIGEANLSSGTIETARQAHYQKKHLACLPLTEENQSNYTAIAYLVNDLKANVLDSSQSRLSFYDIIKDMTSNGPTAYSKQLDLF